jgi:hypothetical protein
MAGDGGRWRPVLCAPSPPRMLSQLAAAPCRGSRCSPDPVGDEPLDGSRFDAQQIGSQGREIAAPWTPIMARITINNL